eukprot:2198116-Amphidinium_carterae.1
MIEIKIENTAAPPQLRVMNPDDPDVLQPRHCAYSLRCASPNEGECGLCGDPRAFLCEHDICTKVLCFNHCRLFNDEDLNIKQI